MQELKISDLLDLIGEDAEKEGSQTALAERLNVSKQYLSDVLNEKRSPGTKILNYYGLTANTTTIYTSNEGKEDK